jgi:hypothetical protein
MKRLYFDKKMSKKMFDFQTQLFNKIKDPFGAIVYDSEIIVAEKEIFTIRCGICNNRNCKLTKTITNKEREKFIDYCVNNGKDWIDESNHYFLNTLLDLFIESCVVYVQEVE